MTAWDTRDPGETCHTPKKSSNTEKCRDRAILLSSQCSGGTAGSGARWPGCPSAFPGTSGRQLWGTVSVWLHPSLPGLWTGPFVQSQEMAVLPKVKVCETDTWGFFPFPSFPFTGEFLLLPSPSSPHTFPGTVPRTTPVPFSPTEGTKSFFYQPTGCSGYKEVKLTMWQCNSPLQAGLDESQK